MQIPSSTYSVHVTNNVFIEHCAGVSLVDHLEDPKVMFQGTDLRHCSLSVLNHPLEECLKLCRLHVLERFLRIVDSRLETKARWRRRDEPLDL